MARLQLLWRAFRDGWRDHRAPRQTNLRGADVPPKRRFLVRLVLPGRDFNARIPAWLKYRHRINLGAADRQEVIPHRSIYMTQHPPTLDELEAFAPVRVPVLLYCTRWLPLLSIGVVLLMVAFGLGPASALLLALSLVVIWRLIDALLVIVWWSKCDYLVYGVKNEDGSQEAGRPGIWIRNGIITPVPEYIEASDFKKSGIMYPWPRWFWSMRRVNIGHAALMLLDTQGHTVVRRFNWQRFPQEVGDLLAQMTSKQEMDQSAVADNTEAQGRAAAMQQYTELRRSGFQHEAAKYALSRMGFNVDDLEERDLFNVIWLPQVVNDDTAIANQPGTPPPLSDETVELPAIPDNGSQSY